MSRTRTLVLACFFAIAIDMEAGVAAGAALSDPFTTCSWTHVQAHLRDVRTHSGTSTAATYVRAQAEYGAALGMAHCAASPGGHPPIPKWQLRAMADDLFRIAASEVIHIGDVPGTNFLANWARNSLALYGDPSAPAETRAAARRTYIGACGLSGTPSDTCAQAFLWVTHPQRPASAAAPETPMPRKICKNSAPRVTRAEPADTSPLATTAGEVVVDVTIDDDGRVTDAKVRESSSVVFNADALRAARGSRFAPGYKDCKPYGGTYHFIVDFDAPPSPAPRPTM
jgi:TonB family protein